MFLNKHPTRKKTKKKKEEKKKKYKSQFSLVQDDIYALGKAHMRSNPSLRSFPKVAFEAVPIQVTKENK